MYTQQGDVRTRFGRIASACLLLTMLPFVSRVPAASKPDVEKALLPGAVVSTGTPEEVTFAAAGEKGITVVCKPGKSDYPGIVIKPSGGVWELSRFGHVEARVTNTGTETMTVALRVDNNGAGEPWNGENAYPKPGETVAVRVRFGYSWGQRGYALNPAKVSEILIFTGKPKVGQSFRIESVMAGGEPGEKPPVNPEDVRIVPKGGVILGPGMNELKDERPVARIGGADVSIGGGALRANLGSGDAIATVKPPVGRWDLRDYLQVAVRVRNGGKTPLTPRARLESAPGICAWVLAAKPVPPGGETEIVLPFAGGMFELAQGGAYQGGSVFDSDRVSGVSIGVMGLADLEVTSIRAVVPPTSSLPGWLGKRPPVDGKWKKTLSEEFDGTALNEKLWTIYHPNYWDKQAHFSKKNVILGGGYARLRFEKKRGHENDDPSKPETDWATGFITSTHKWTQRYGYFECRMKLPRAPGMWPAFWMMPDRGPSAGAAREDTRDGGMEFDILEYLTRYGPYRYNVACHWDGYDKDHKSLGTERIYVQPDKEGFYTAGILWEPGSATFYCQGKPVARWQNPRVASVPMYILFTAVSGGWGGNTVTGEGLPSDYVLDYVRAWERD